MPAMIVVAAVWGPHMLNRVTVVEPEDVAIRLPTRGMA